MKRPMDRMGFVGASDVPAIIGISKWKTPHQLWLEKTGQKEPDPPNLYTEVGTQLEPLVLELASLRLKAQLFTGPMLHHPTEPWMRVALDGLVELPDGETTVLEAKTCSFSKRDGGWGPAGSEMVPAEYWAQVQTQMLVMRANGHKVERAIIACLFLNRLGDGMEKMPQLFSVPFDAVAADGLLERAKTFWARVTSRTWPEHMEAA